MFRKILIALGLIAVSACIIAATSDTLNVARGTGGAVASVDLGKTVQPGPIDIDFSKYAAASTTVTANSYVSLYQMPKNSVLLGISYIVLTAQGGTCTAKVGYSTAGKGGYWSSAVNFNSVAWGWLPCITAGGDTFSAATMIRLTMNHDVTKAKVRFYPVFYTFPGTDVKPFLTR